jgi:hypothetical protein
VPQRRIAEELGVALDTVNKDIAIISQEFLKEARKQNALGKVLIQLWEDRDTVIKGAWKIYSQTSDPDSERWNPHAANNALGTIDRANKNFVSNITRLGISQAAPERVEHSVNLGLDLSHLSDEELRAEAERIAKGILWREKKWKKKGGGE